ELEAFDAGKAALAVLDIGLLLCWQVGLPRCRRRACLRCGLRRALGLCALRRLALRLHVYRLPLPLELGAALSRQSDAVFRRLDMNVLGIDSGQRRLNDILVIGLIDVHIRLCADSLPAPIGAPVPGRSAEEAAEQHIHAALHVLKFTPGIEARQQRGAGWTRRHPLWTARNRAGPILTVVPHGI